MKQDSNRSDTFTNGEANQSPPKISDHELLRKIGSGSYGEVWLARSVTGIYRAVKIINRSRFHDDAPYQREFEGIRRFEPVSRDHPGLMDILHVGRDDAAGFFYYVLELADDEDSKNRSERNGTTEPNRSVSIINIESFAPKTLKGVLRRSRDLRSHEQFGLGTQECVDLAIALTSALAHLHRHNLVHRDIKPENIIFANGVAKLADIGLVTEATRESSLLGTATYLPPEGSGEKQADIYSLGLVLYEMITGLDSTKWPTLPTGFENASEELKGLNKIAMRACSGDPKQRYDSTEQMQSVLDWIKNIRLRKVQRDLRRLRLIIVAMVGFLVIGLVAFRFWMLQQRAAEDNHRRILSELQTSRMQLRTEGWFLNYWKRLKEAAAIRKDKEVMMQASALLARLDARGETVLHNVAASSAAFSPDGQALIGGTEGTPAYLIAANGTATQLPFRGAGPVCWTSDGNPLQLITVTNGLILREMPSGSARRTFRLDGATPSVSDYNPVVALATDGTMVAAGLRNRLVVWKTETVQISAEIPASVTALAFSPDGLLLGAGYGDGTSRIYSVSDLSEIAALPPPLRGNPILCMAFGRDPLIRYDQNNTTTSWLMATGDQGASIIIWDLAKRMPRSFCRGSTWIVSAIAFSPDGSTIASAGRNQPRLWDVASGRPLLQLSETSSGASVALAFDSTGQRLLSGGLAEAGQATTALWRLEPHRGIHALRSLAAPVRKVWVSANSKRVAALSDDWRVGVWEVTLNRLLYTLEVPIGIFADSAGGCFARNGEQFAFSSGQEARLYDLRTGSISKKWTLNKGRCDQLQSDAHGRLILLRCEGSPINRKSVWRLYELGAAPDPVLLHEQKETDWWPEDVALSPGGARFMVWNRGQKGNFIIRAYEVGTGQELWKQASEKTGNFRVCFDPNGREFGYTHFALDDHLRLINISNFKEIGTTAANYQAISPSGLVFASTSGSKESWLYQDFKAIQNTISLATDFDGDSWVSAFSPDGKLLTWGTEQGVVLVADIEEIQRRISEVR